jgi:repressor LexA
MTPRQKEIYDWIVSETLAYRPPTARELCKQFGITSPNGIMCHLKAFEKQGLILRHKDKARSFVVVELARKAQLKQNVIDAAIELVELGDDGAFSELKRAVREYRK